MGQKSKNGGEAMKEKINIRVPEKLRRQIEEYQKNSIMLRGEELQVAIRSLIRAGLKASLDAKMIEKREFKIAEDNDVASPSSEGDQLRGGERPADSKR